MENNQNTFCELCTFIYHLGLSEYLAAENTLFKIIIRYFDTVSLIARKNKSINCIVVLVRICSQQRILRPEDYLFPSTEFPFNEKIRVGQLACASVQNARITRWDIGTGR